MVTGWPWKPSLDQAIAVLFGQQITRATDQPQSVVSPAGQDSLQEVRVNFDAAQQALQNGDWQEFGRAKGASAAVPGTAGALNRRKNDQINKLASTR